MGKIRLLLLAISLGLLASLNSCGFPNSHRLDETLYYFKNETEVTIYLALYNKLTAGKISLGLKYAPNEERIRSGGGTLNRIQ